MQSNRLIVGSGYNDLRLWIGRCGEIFIPSRKLLLFILNHLADPQSDLKSQIQGGPRWLPFNPTRDILAFHLLALVFYCSPYYYLGKVA